MRIVVTKNAELIILVCLVVCFSGCSVSLETTKKTYELAQKNYEIARNLVQLDKEKYSDELDESKTNLDNASDYLKKGSTGNAYKSSVKSLAKSNKLLTEIYHARITPMAKELKAKIEQIDDTDNPLKDPKIIKKIDNILEQSDSLPDMPEISESKQIDAPTEERIFDLAQLVMNDFACVAKIKEIADTSITKKLVSDVSFDIGEYELSSEGKRILDEFGTEVIEGIGNEPVMIKLKVVGYTDQVDFNENGRLFRKLMKEIGDKSPNEKVERRIFLNKYLSGLRAKTISSYTEKSIGDNKEADSDIEVRLEVIGRGEEIPSDVSSPYPTRDPRRRVCKIYVYRTLKESKEMLGCPDIGLAAE